jgi:hypothetical protein
MYAFAHHISFEIFWLADGGILHGARCVFMSSVLCVVEGLMTGRSPAQGNPPDAVSGDSKRKRTGEREYSLGP